MQLFWPRLIPNINNTSNRQSIQPVQKGLFQQSKEFSDSPSTKMIESEKLCLQWNEFQNIVSSAFEDLRSDGDLTDVTLACEDGKQIEAHKVVLSATSPFFLDLLKRNKHPHPLIYMKGIKSDNLMAMVDFFYRGEANVSQDNLNDFLALADEMRLKGLNRQEEPQEILDNARKSQTQNYDGD